MNNIYKKMVGTLVVALCLFSANVNAQCTLTCPADITISTDPGSATGTVAAFATTPANCAAVVAVVTEDFGDGTANALPAGWSVDDGTSAGGGLGTGSTSDGATVGCGIYTSTANSGTQQAGGAYGGFTDGWLGIEDDAAVDAPGCANIIGLGCVLTDVYDLTSNPSQTGHTLSINWQNETFVASGQTFIDVWDGAAWVNLQTATADTDSAEDNPAEATPIFAGDPDVYDLSAVANATTQFRMCYDDEGAFAWGAGFDNFLIEANDASTTVVTNDSPFATSASSSDGDAAGAYPIGTTTVTFTTADPAGGLVTCSANITVEDNEAPVISNCPGDLVLTLGPGECEAIYSYSEILATDNVPGPSSIVNSAPANPLVGGNGQSGNMFDLSNGGADDVLISAFEVNLDPGTWNMEVYYTTTATTVAGNNAAPGAWTLMGTAVVTSTAGNVPTLLTPTGGTPFVLPAGASKGVYVTVTNGTAINYTNGTGTDVFTDGTLTVDCTTGIGLGVVYPFGFTFSPRNFNGNILYSTFSNAISGVQTSGQPSGTSLPVGTTTNTFTFTDAAGNVSTCTWNVDVIEFTGAISSIACNDNVQVSVDQNCQAVVGADMILEGGPYACYDNYTVSINGGSNVVNASMIGLTLPVTVTDAAGNSCWGTISIEDKIDPTIVCYDQNISCTDPLPTEPAPATNVATAFEGGAGTAILDNSTATFTIDVPGGAATINDVNVAIDITHTWIGDLNINVISPAGTSVNLWGGFCGGTDNLFFTADDEGMETVLCVDYATSGLNLMAAGLIPVPMLSAFDGEPAGGTWTVTIADGATGDQGTVNRFALEIDASAAQQTPADGCGTVTTTYSDVVNDNGCAGTTIVRTYTTTDGSGNTASCVQNINIAPATFADITLPGDITIDCSQDPTDLSITGEPGGATCFNIEATLVGDVHVATCGAGYKIVRTWLLTDWCGPTPTMEHVQFIKVEDTTAPTVVNPGTINIGTTSNACAGNVILPTLSVSDDCSDVGTPVFTLGGVVINNGILTNAPVGTHTIDYSVSDACGNEATGSFQLVVEDNIAPLAICDEHTTASIGSDGYVTINALTFDDGSYDNCGIVDMSVRRMNNTCGLPGATSFGPSVTFCCADIGSTVMVGFRVTDAAGNQNFCMVEVTVTDKLAPTIICPANKTISCTDDYTDLQLTGQAVATDNCDPVTPGYIDNANINDCGEGTVTRIWSVQDASGNPASCVQFITITNPDPFDGNDITWPLDYDDDTCNGNLDPSNLPSPYNGPTLAPTACGNIFVGHDDLNLSQQDPACIKILRTWTVIDWCQYTPNTPGSPGIWTYEQVLKIENSTPPQLNCGGDSFVQNFEPNCGTTFVNLTATGSDDCTPAGDLTYSWTMSNGQSGTGNNASQAFSNGNYSITWTVEDGCGLSQSCTFPFQVVDAKKPTPVCVSLSSVVMPNSGMLQLWASDFESGSSFDNCTPYSGLQFSFSSNTSETSRTFTCADIANDNVVPVQIWVTDAAGNQDFCSTFVVINDTESVCTTTTQTSIDPQGTILTADQDEVELVDVSLVGSTFGAVTTGANGTFTFPTMPIATAGTYEVSPFKNINPTNGVTTFDLVQIQKHILGVELLDSPYKEIAADGNDSETITTFDLVVLRKLILGTDTEFQGTQTSWRFVDADHAFPNGTFPFPETIDVSALPTGASADFVAVKIGDINGSASPNSLLGTDTRTFNGDLVFHLEDRKVAAGEEFTVDFNTKDFNNTLGYQFTLGFDNNKVEFVDLATNLIDLGEANFGLNRLEEGIITTSWNSYKGIDVADNTSVFSLTFTATEAANISEIFNINSRYTQAEAYNGSDLYDVALAFNGEVATADFALYQNTPNPFKDVTTIGFNLPEASTTTLKIYDVSGKVIRLMEIEGVKGFNSVTLNRAELGSTGVLYYQLETANHTATLKMILVD